MRTFWQYSVQTYANGKAGCSVGSGSPSLDTALAKAFQGASYYLLACGYEVTITLEKQCAVCSNLGQIVKVTGPRTTKIVRCPECKGNPPEETIGPFAATLHENVANAVGPCLP